MTLVWLALTIVGSIAAVLTLPGTVELLGLSLGALLPGRRRISLGKSFRLAVVIPAHNEETSIGECVRSVGNADRGAGVDVVVVADNCSDRTAEVAQGAGARVLVRQNLVERGKGYALDYAFSKLAPEGFDGFLVIDADSTVSANLLSEVAGALAGGADAAQCRYLVRNPGASIRTRLMNLALMAFNVARPKGRDRLGLSAGIYGNGFALSAETLREVPYTAASVVEDLEYHLALVRARKRVQFIDTATVYGEMPVAGKGVETQRTRWEGGRFRMLFERGPSLALELLKGQLRLLEPLLDLVLLPLAFHVSLLVLAVLTPDWPVRLIGLTGLGIVGFHLAGAIVAGGGGWRDLITLLAAPFYVLWKILLIPALFKASRSEAAWVRTERTAPVRK